MMRQSPKPYAKGKERQNPSSSPVSRSIAKAGGICPLFGPWITEIQALD